MKIRGEIVHQRPYSDVSDQKIHLLLLKVQEGVLVNGVTIHTIPVLTSAGITDRRLGDSIDITGRMELRRVKTPAGNLSSSPIPVFIHI
ncbi:hypothetical protein [Ammoniphilus sp. YIM 78166]|uniref:hypothetical protein n=1 Tax=Ammoniphilus sp. YIM 78166 TaxID=1644106 RepID=UPI00106F6D64|nr:hypothetical protein [Ammoniphilus sp. YIM 78166]